MEVMLVSQPPFEPAAGFDPPLCWVLPQLVSHMLVGTSSITVGDLEGQSHDYVTLFRRHAEQVLRYFQSAVELATANRQTLRPGDVQILIDQAHLVSPLMLLVVCHPSWPEGFSISQPRQGEMAYLLNAQDGQADGIFLRRLV